MTTPITVFDYVILSQTLQQVYKPAALLHSLSRIGRQVIVSFPNFSHYSIRLQLLIKGVAPKNEQLPYSWYDSPNIRVITLADFRKFAGDVGYTIVKEVAINTDHHDRQGHIVHWLTNLRASYGIFAIEKRRQPQREAIENNLEIQLPALPNSCEMSGNVAFSRMGRKQASLHTGRPV